MKQYLNLKMDFLTRDFFARDTVTVAQDLIGTTLVTGKCTGRIIETEAYTTDAASHAAKRTNRSALMYETYGHIYVYMTYGMYYCLNFTCERDGIGAVLIRAIEPIRGIEEMQQRRRTDSFKKLASGPGRLSQAFAIDLSFNGKPIGQELKLRERQTIPQISASPRIGISKATELEWRFFEKGNPFISPSKFNQSA
jgi:DNA-3-methyladenine glycosylase